MLQGSETLDPASGGVVILSNVTRCGGGLASDARILAGRYVALRPGCHGAAFG